MVPQPFLIGLLSLVSLRRGTSVTVETPLRLRRVRTVGDSPSLVQLVRDPKTGTNIFSSPSCILAGGNRSAAIDIRQSPSVVMLTRESSERSNALESPSAIYQGVSEQAMRNALTSPSVQRTYESKTRYDLPLPLVVGHPLVKTALLACAVNPFIGGLIIEGGRGTGKTVLARALHRILPPIDIVRGSPYHVHPNATSSQIDDFLLKELKETGRSLCDLPKETITCPFTQVPLNIMEDRLFGAVDVKRTLAEGETVFTPGILASANRGIRIEYSGLIIYYYCRGAQCG